MGAFGTLPMALGLFVVPHYCGIELAGPLLAVGLFHWFLAGIIHSHRVPSLVAGLAWSLASIDWLLLVGVGFVAALVAFFVLGY
ncbi:MAG TPA: hypothetical protein VHB79_18995 [Polyangiaceae bacterium]|nr:hypothetical protein [Polyangiaceae bacterium]